MSLRKGFRLGNWTVKPLESVLVGESGERRVRPRAMDVLLCLAEADGAVVEREELLRQVWGERAVSDEPLTRCIGELRKAFGDTRENPAYIGTIPKRGYRLLAPVNAEPDEAPADTGGVAAAAGGGFPLPVPILLGIAVLTILFLGWLSPWSTPREEAIQPTATMSAARSILVLPFDDLSAAKDQEYMGDGIAEELLNLLASIKELRVISRSSAFSLKGRPLDLRAVARQFNVAYILEGSVRTSGNTIRITAQLIDGRTDAHVWSQSYERELEDVFAIQDEIAQAVVRQLQVTLLGDTPRSRPTDPEAYALFLKARSLHEQPAGDAFLQAFDYYKAALDIDKSYVPAWVWLAALYDDTTHSSGLPYDEVGRLARDAIDRALAIAPDDPLALGMSAILRRDWDNDLVTAAAQMQRALELDSSNPILLRWAAIVLTGVGRHDDAIRLAEHLFERDPVGRIAKINLASVYLNGGRYADAVRICDIEVSSSAESGPCDSRLIRGYLGLEDDESALKHISALEGSRVHLRLAPMVYFANGRQADYQLALDNLVAAYRDGDRNLAYWIAYNHSYTGNDDGMYAWFGQAIDDGAFRMTPGQAHFARHTGDPRWAELMERLGMAPDDLAAIRLVVPPT